MESNGVEIENDENSDHVESHSTKFIIEELVHQQHGQQKNMAHNMLFNEDEKREDVPELFIKAMCDNFLKCSFSGKVSPKYSLSRLSREQFS